MPNPETPIVICMHCDQPAILVLVANPSKRTMPLCRECATAGLTVPDLTEETRLFLRSQLALTDGTFS